ncbi:hypothetical protein G6011_09476 [Alternaria panax]|uniref:Heterokaryon incompatibility domain-containing protein n=1 Tax=Alternaria panax TaxID=48097 RepID=A0AAD4IB16_9PLEO|nr:hypothetical protein G6011_09476 [Alternaria panax]
MDGFEYLALSHMWGTDSSQQLRLTASTLQEYQEAIPRDMLPSIFTEAIRITRYLGFRYLWIDSLCIIQDSKSDWTAEANMMSAVYNNAVCTIAVLYPPQVAFSSTQCRDDPRDLTPCIVREPSREKAGISVFPYKFLKRSALAQEDWPLSSRAWTLQEHILSPRTIFYGHRTLKWECVEIFCDELAGTIGDHTASNLPSMTQRELLSTRPIYEPNETPETAGQVKKFSDTLWRWVALMQEYRRRDLTQASDRTMAFSGIAQAFQAEHGLTYLAGIWKEHLPRSLLWHIHHSEDTLEHFSSTLLEPRMKFVPTWSLFAGPIYSNRDDMLYQDLNLLADRILSTAKFLHFRWRNAPMGHVPPTAFHDFEGLQITLELMVIDVSFSLSHPPPENHLYRVHCKSTEALLISLFRVDEESVGLTFHFDDVANFEEPPAGARMAIIEEGWDSDRNEYCFQGLLIQPGAKKKTWVRLGYCEGFVWLLSSLSRQNSFKSAAGGTVSDTSTLKWGEESVFLCIEGATMETLTLV